MNTDSKPNNQVPPAPQSDTPRWIGYQQAKAEERNWDKEGKLRGQEENNHLLWLKAYGRLVALFLIFFALLFLGSLGSWAAHYLLPEKFHWLTLDQLSKIQSVLFSGSIGGVVTLMAQKQMSK